MSINPRVSKTLKQVDKDRQTGAMISQSDTLKRLLFFEQGQLVGCRSSIPQERLGAILLREDRITPKQLKRAAEHIRTGRKVGQILVALGYLNGGEIQGFVRLQVLEVASRMLLEPCERLVFSDQIPVEAATLSPVTVAEVFIHASRRLEDVGRYLETVLGDECVLVRVSDPPVPVEKLDLSTEELTIVELVDSGRSVKEILSASSASVDKTLQTLVGLLHAGVVERAPTPDAGENVTDADAFRKRLERVHAQMQDQNHWAMLGLEQGASYAALTKAYAEIRERFELAKFAHIPDGDLHKKLTFIQARARDAFLTLSARSQAIAYEKLVRWEKEYESQREDWEKATKPLAKPAKDSQRANEVFARAKEAFRRKDYWSAIQLCRSAIELSEKNDADHYHVLGAALAHNPRWRKDAEKHMKIAIQLNPWDGRYLVTLAKFYHLEGQAQRAQQLLAQVKAVDPHHPLPDLQKLASEASVRSK